MRRKKILFAFVAVVLITAFVLPVPIVSGEYDPWEGYNEITKAQEEEWARMSGPDYGKVFLIVIVVISLLIALFALIIAMEKKKEAERLYLERMERREK